MKAKSIKLYLNPNDASERRVLDYLRYSGDSNTNAITAAVLFYLDAQENGTDRTAILQAIRDTIRETIQGLQLVPTDSGRNLTLYDEEEPVSMLDFLDELECGVISDEE